MLETKDGDDNWPKSWQESSAGELNFYDPGPELEWQRRLNSREGTYELVINAVAFIKAKLSTFALLNLEEEQELALALSNHSKALALLTMASTNGAKELLRLAQDAASSSLKKRLFAKESRYFALRREMDDLINTEQATRALGHFISTGQAYVKHDNRLPVALVEAVCHIDWPGPLMLAFAKRNVNDEFYKSTLTLAIDEYFEQKNILANSDDTLSRDHQGQLNYHVQGYLTARDTLVNHNLRMVFHIAKRYALQTEYLPDLIQEGTFGLIRAAEKYRLASGHRFSTYAHQWIESKIRKARVNIDKVIPISHDYNNDLLRMSQYKEKCIKSGVKVTFEDMATAAQISEERKKTIAQFKQYGMSLDAPLEEGEGTSLHTSLPDPTSNVVDSVLKQRKADYLNFVVEAALTEREAYVVNERYGRLDSDPRTLKELSHILGLSRERIRQLEIEALKKLNDWMRANSR